MSIFTKPLADLVTSDLQELLGDKAVENARLEFKRELPKKDDVLKKLSSFANTFGGFMVVGASANSEDGRIEALPGVEEESKYKQTIVDWCFAGASPPLSVEVSDPIPAPSGEARVCYVISVVESDIAPHFLNGRKGVWVRTDEFSARFEARLANDNELRHLLERRRLIRDRRDNLLARARNRFDTYAARIPKEPGVHRADPTRLELCVVPRFPARPLCEQKSIASFINGNRIGWRGDGFPVSGSSTISQHESAVVLGPVGGASLFEANVWGMMFYCTKIADKHGPQGTYGIHLYEFVGAILLFVRHADVILQNLGYSGPIQVQTAVRALREVPWLYGSRAFPGGIFTKNASSQLDDDVEFSIVTTTDDMKEKPDEVVMKILYYALFSVDMPDLINTQPKVEQLLRQAYQYNDWHPPESWGK